MVGNVSWHFILDGFVCSAILIPVVLARWPQKLVQPRAANLMAGLIPGHGKNEWVFYREEETKLSLQSSTYFSGKWLSVAGGKQ